MIVEQKSIEAVIKTNTLESKTSKQFMSALPTQLQDIVVMVITRSDLEWCLSSDKAWNAGPWLCLHGYVKADMACAFNLFIARGEAKPDQYTLQSLTWAYRCIRQKYHVLDKNKIETFCSEIILAALPSVIDTLSNTARVVPCPRCVGDFLLGQKQGTCSACHETRLVSRQYMKNSEKGVA